METAGGIPREMRLSDSPMVAAAVEDFCSEAPEGRATKKAPCFHAAMVAALEAAVINEGLPAYTRAYAWWKTLQC
eukprot:11424260-Alexandrium_andersonii.AAC.1